MDSSSWPDLSAAREEIARLASEQAALRRVAALVAKAAAPEEIFAAVAEELAQLSGAGITVILRYEAEGAATVLGCWSDTGVPALAGTRLAVAGDGVAATVLRTGQPAWAARFAGPPGSVADYLRSTGMRVGTGSPVVVDGRLWGAVVTATTRPDGLRPGDEHRMTAFAELVGTAIANAQGRVELRAIAEEQTALRRVAMLVAVGAEPGTVFAAVAEEVGQVLPEADFALVARYDAGHAVEVVGGWSRTGAHMLIGRRLELGGRNVSTLVFETGQAARVDYLADDGDAVTASARAIGMRSSAGAPISVDGRLWGVMIATSVRENALPPATERRLVAFTELIATTIANAQARQELRAIAEEQAALRRVATLVAQGASAAALFRAVAEETSLLLRADATVLMRYDPDDCVTRVGRWSRPGIELPPGERSPLGGRNVTTLVFETGQAARLDNYGDDAGDAAVWVDAGLCSSVGVPISVEGRLWGVAVALSMSAQPLPADADARLAGFTELVATAIANAEAQAELTASRARIIVTADETRRRIERDLHDGAQQRLVSLALQLRAAQADVPAEFGRLHAALDRVAVGLASTLDELREYARGIHPAILAEGGLRAALQALARRSPVPVTLDVRTHDRLPERLEVTAYYVVSEALANAAKYAEASAVHVDIEETDEAIRLAVRDDGVGGADPARGSGLVGLQDRVAAVGGTLSVRSRPAEGTTLLVELPLNPARLSAG
jgi:signal transduction histidine kinase